MKKLCLLLLLNSLQCFAVSSESYFTRELARKLSNVEILKGSMEKLPVERGIKRFILKNGIKIRAYKKFAILSSGPFFIKVHFKKDGMLVDGKRIPYGEKSVEVFNLLNEKRVSFTSFFIDEAHAGIPIVVGAVLVALFLDVVVTVTDVLGCSNRFKRTMEKYKIRNLHCEMDKNGDPNAYRGSYLERDGIAEGIESLFGDDEMDNVSRDTIHRMCANETEEDFEWWAMFMMRACVNENEVREFCAVKTQYLLCLGEARQAYRQRNNSRGQHDRNIQRLEVGTVQFEISQ